MILVVEIFKTIGLTIWAFFKGLWDASPALIELGLEIQKIRSLFNWENILQYGFGVPEILVAILSAIVTIITVLRFLYKKGIIGRD